MEIEIWTDGACEPNPGQTGIGVIIKRGSQRQEISKACGYGTSNTAELQAVAEALVSIEDRFEHDVVVYTDSKYAQGVLSGRYRIKKNIDLVLGIQKLMLEFRSCDIKWIKGHAGLWENELADRLAIEGINSSEMAWRPVVEKPVVQLSLF